MKYHKEHLGIIIGGILVLSAIFTISIPERATAGSYNGQDLALAILANQSTLISSSYWDRDTLGHRQEIVLSSLGTTLPTNGSTFALLSTGIAGTPIVTTGATNPGSERGSWFAGGQYGWPRDEATLTMTLQVPQYMHYLYYDVQFFSAEYPEYVGTLYNDKLTITVDSPSKGTTKYIFDVNSGYFVWDSNSIPGTGFNIFAQSGNPNDVDIVDTTPRTPGADAGASDIIPIGGVYHPVSPNEQITVTINIKDAGDNQFDSAAFIDNLMFSGYAKTDIIARKTAQDLNGPPLECGDTVKYAITISNIGTDDQTDNPGNEFEDIIPKNTTYVPGSATAVPSGTIGYSGGKIIWNGGILAQHSVALTFEVNVNQSLKNGTIISNQGTVYWDSNGCHHANEATELTDDPSVPGDHNPTNVTVIAFEPPPSVTENFSDDVAGGKATQSYYGRKWFETSEGTLGSVFEVASGPPGYYYSTNNSFKIKIRLGGTQYWNYTLSQLESDMVWWEACFACGNTSEASDLYMDFKNNAGNNIARMRFEYVCEGTEPPMNWLLKIYYMDPDPAKGWSQLSSNCLCNGWYKLRIEKNGLNNINYSLYKSSSLIDSNTSGQLSAPFANFARVEWYSTKNPVVCPMFFWDEHKLGLI